MLPLIIIIAIALLLVLCVYLKVRNIFIRRIIRSAVKSIIIIDVMLSIIISLSIVSTDVAFVCDVRYIDFFITVCNVIYFSILLGYLSSKVITRPRLAYFIAKNIIPTFLVIAHIVLAAVAHFAGVKEKGDKVSVYFCYDERGTTLVTASYCYVFGLLVLCIVLMIFKLYRSRRYCKLSGKIEMFCIALLSISMAVIHLLSLLYVLFPNYETDCAHHADSLVVTALFPAIISLLSLTFSIIEPVHRRIRRWYLRRAGERKNFIIPLLQSCCVLLFPFREKY